MSYSFLSVLKPYLENSVGRPATQSFIWEKANDRTKCVFTIKDDDFVTDDGRTMYSLPKLYMEIADPTEYEFARQVFGSWKYWQQFRMCVREEHRDWQEELEIKLRSQALRNLALLQYSDKEATAIQAQKYVAEYGWDKKVGRPSKADVQRQQRIHAGISDEVNEDLQRIKKIY